MGISGPILTPGGCQWDEARELPKLLPVLWGWEGRQHGRWTSKACRPLLGSPGDPCLSGCFGGFTPLQCLLSLSLAIKKNVHEKKHFSPVRLAKEVCVCVTERGNRQNRLHLESRTPFWAGLWTLSHTQYPWKWHTNWKIRPPKQEPQGSSLDSVA